MGAGVSKIPEWYPGEPTAADSDVRQAGLPRSGWSPIDVAPDGAEENERALDRLPVVELTDMEVGRIWHVLLLVCIITACSTAAGIRSAATLFSTPCDHALARTRRCRSKDKERTQTTL